MNAPREPSSGKNRSFVRFGATVWADIDRARKGDRTALNRLLATYRPPLLRFLRRSGLSDADAEDLAQEVLIEIVYKDLLRKAAPEEGRFRNLLLGVTRQFLRSHFRRERRWRRNRDVARPSPDAEEEAFESIWVRHVLLRALKRLEGESQELGNRQHEIVRLAILENASYSEVAHHLNLDLTVVRNALHRGRRKLMAHLRQEVAAYAGKGPALEAELRFVFGLLGLSLDPDSSESR